MMVVSVYLPLIACLLVALTSPFIAARTPPHVATRVLSVCAGVLAVASTWGLGLLTCTLLAQAPVLAERGHWSRQALSNHDPVPTGLAALAAAALLLIAAGLRRNVRRRRNIMRVARVACRAGIRAGGELVVLDGPIVQAFAVPGRRPAIVVTSSMLRALDAQERRALLAHERAHLAHHHHRFQAIADLAAACNPLLRRLRADIAYSIERWADEDAAARTTRPTVASALAKAALARHDTTAPGLAFNRLQVSERVGAMLQPGPLVERGPRGRLAAASAVLACLITAGVATLTVIDATVALDALMQAARASRS